MTQSLHTQQSKAGMSLLMMMMEVMRRLMITRDIAGRYISKLAGYHPLTHNLLCPLLLCHRLQ